MGRLRIETFCASVRAAPPGDALGRPSSGGAAPGLAVAGRTDAPAARGGPGRLRGSQGVTMPPLTFSVSPETQLDSAEARKTNAGAISAGWPAR